jgi:hypothetical protein
MTYMTRMYTGAAEPFDAPCDGARALERLRRQLQLRVGLPRCAAPSRGRLSGLHRPSQFQRLAVSLLVSLQETIS